MPREFRQCWAYYDSNRCSLRAGHQGDHVRKITWTDADCQGAPLLEVFADQPIPLTITQPPPPPPDGKCVACHHHRHTGECYCGCKEFIG